ENPRKQVRFADKCVMRLAERLGTDLIRIGRRSYKSKDGKCGYVITTSKMYTQGSREKYWFAYRKKTLDELKDCEKRYIVYGCRKEQTLVVLPVSKIEQQLERLSTSRDEEGKISDWNNVCFNDCSCRVTRLQHNP